MIETYRLLWQLLSPTEKRRFVLILIMVAFMAVFEAVGVAMLLPFLQVLAKPETIQTNSTLRMFWEWGGFTSIQSYITALGLAVFVFIVFSLAFRAASTYVLMRFCLMRAYSWGARLLQKYLYQPYVWFLTRNTAELGQTVLSEIDVVVQQSLLPAVVLISHTLVALLIIGVVCLIEPWIALGIFVVLGGGYIVVYFMLRKKLESIGRQRYQTNRARFLVAQEATSGLKELKVMGIEDAFIKRFRLPAQNLARHQTKGQTFSKLPRFALEGLTYGGFIIMVLVLQSRQGADIVDMLPFLGLIGMAGSKLFPSLQQIYQQISQMRFSGPALVTLHDNITNLKIPDASLRDVPPLHLEKSFELRNVTFHYNKDEKAILDKISLTFPKGDTIGIVGGTGAGKTTVVDLILGLLEPDSGELIADGMVITTQNIRAWQKNLGYVPQHIFLSDSSVAENIAFGVEKELIDHEAVERAARIAQLHDFVMSELPDRYETEVGEKGVRLSGGQRQRIGIARALYYNPEILVFDEATSALDNLTEQALIDAVHNIGKTKTVIMIAHRLSTVKDCDTIFLLEAGKLIAKDKYEELIARNETFKKMALG